jgi:hypothetical protein
VGNIPASDATANALASKVEGDYPGVLANAPPLSLLTASSPPSATLRRSTGLEAVKAILGRVGPALGLKEIQPSVVRPTPPG